jgi:hypothetical protein
MTREQQAREIRADVLSRRAAGDDARRNWSEVGRRVVAGGGKTATKTAISKW